MEKKLKIAEFASLIGITAKTVYKMVERGELKTVSEKVNNRWTTLVLTNDVEVEKFKTIYGKSPVNIGNYEDMLTDNEEELNYNNPSQFKENAESASKILDKFIEANKEYNIQLMKLNEELVNTKAKMLFLEDKASREGMYLNEINELKTENKQLMNSKQVLSYLLITVVALLLLVLVGCLTFNIAAAQKKEHVQEEIVLPQ